VRSYIPHRLCIATVIILCMSNTLLLFDIDGTFLTTGGAGMRAMRIVAERLFGASFSWEGVVPAGHLDPLIFAEAAARNGLNHDPAVQIVFRDQYLAQLKYEFDANRDAIVTMPGVHEILAELREQEDVMLGLLTGNYTKAVPIKLGAISIDPAMFKITAFGDEAATRADMVALAIKRYEKHQGEAIDPKQVIIIGDTPRDVQCAHAHGCLCLAVATGRYSVDQLKDAGADQVVSDLCDSSPLLAMMDR